MTTDVSTFKMPDVSSFYEGDAPQFKPLSGWNKGTILASYTSAKDGTRYELSSTVDNEGRNKLTAPIQFSNPAARDGKQIVFFNLTYTIEDLNAMTSIPKSFQDIPDKATRRLWFLRAAVAGLTKVMGTALTITGENGNAHINASQLANRTLDVNLQVDDKGRSQVNGFNPFRPTKG